MSRWHLPTYSYLRDDGKLITRKYRENGVMKTYPVNIYSDSDNDYRHFITLQKYGKLYIDEMMLEAWGKPCPGPEFAVKHLDGDWGNDNIKNLAWELRSKVYFPQQVTTADQVKFQEVVVYKRGTVKQNGRELPVRSSSFDGDVDLLRPIIPQVSYSHYIKEWKRYEDRHIDMDELMDRVGYIAGNKKAHLKPKVLHKDHDQMNFASDNLEWVDESDQRWIDYKNSWPSRYEVYSKLNPGRDAWVKAFLGIK